MLWNKVAASCHRARRATAEIAAVKLKTLGVVADGMDKKQRVHKRLSAFMNRRVDLIRKALDASPSFLTRRRQRGQYNPT